MSVRVVPALPRHREGWGRLYAGYAAFYGVAQTEAMRDTVWGWIHDPAAEVKALVAEAPDGEPVEPRLGVVEIDGLVEEMGGPPTPSVGWAAGIERLSMLLTETPDAPRPVAIIPIGEAQEAPALALGQRLRAIGIPVEIAYRGNTKRRMERANKVNAIAAILIGETEIAEGLYVLKNLDEGSQARLGEAELPRALAMMGVLEAAAAPMAEEIAGGDDEGP